MNPDIDEDMSKTLHELADDGPGPVTVTVAGPAAAGTGSAGTDRRPGFKRVLRRTRRADRVRPGDSRSHRESDSGGESVASESVTLPRGRVTLVTVP